MYGVILALKSSCLLLHSFNMQYKVKAHLMTHIYFLVVTINICNMLWTVMLWFYYDKHLSGFLFNGKKSRCHCPNRLVDSLVKSAMQYLLSRCFTMEKVLNSALWRIFITQLETQNFMSLYWSQEYKKIYILHNTF